MNKQLSAFSASLGQCINRLNGLSPTIIKWLRNKSSTQIWIATTVAFLSAAVLTYLFLPTNDVRSAVGTYFGGAATAAAIIWIVYNANLQAQSIAMQKQELELQREATQSIAQSAQMDTFLKLFEMSTLSLANETRTLLGDYFEKCDLSRQQEFNSLNTKFQSGDRDVYFSFVANDREFQSWLSCAALKDDAPSTIAITKQLCERYAKLMNACQRVPNGADIATFLVSPSQLAQCVRTIKSLVIN